MGSQFKTRSKRPINKTDMLVNGELKLLDPRVILHQFLKLHPSAFLGKGWKSNVKRALDDSIAPKLKTLVESATNWWCTPPPSSTILCYPTRWLPTLAKFFIYIHTYRIGTDHQQLKPFFILPRFYNNEKALNAVLWRLIKWTTEKKLEKRLLFNWKKIIEEE